MLKKYITKQIDNTGIIIIDNEEINKEDNHKYQMPKYHHRKGKFNTEIDERIRLKWTAYAV